MESLSSSGKTADEILNLTRDAEKANETDRYNMLYQLWSEMSHKEWYNNLSEEERAQEDRKREQRAFFSRHRYSDPCVRRTKANSSRSQKRLKKMKHDSSA